MISLSTYVIFLTTYEYILCTRNVMYEHNQARLGSSMEVNARLTAEQVRQVQFQHLARHRNTSLNALSTHLPQPSLLCIFIIQSFTWHSLPRHHKIRDQRAECKRTADEDNADARSYTPRAVEYHRAFLTDFQHSVYLGFCLFAVMAVSLA